jgi:FMN-dependent NADH-azoreductase
VKLLRIDSSARSLSVTRRLTAVFAEHWKHQHPAGLIVHRELHSLNVPPITDDWSATFGAPEDMTAEQRSYLTVSDAFIAELMEADVVLIGAPVYNLMISAPLKAWIDHVVRLNRTVAYGPSGPHGLLKGKRVIVVTSRGGASSPDPRAPNFDLQASYLRHVLAFIGLDDVAFVQAENQRGAQGQAAFDGAVERLKELAVMSVQSNLKPGDLTAMQTIPPVPPQALEGHARELLAGIEKRLGRVPNMLQTLANSSAALEGYLAITGAFQKTRIDAKLRALLTAAVAQQLNSDYILSFAYTLAAQDGVTELELNNARKAESADTKIDTALKFAARAASANGRLPQAEAARVLEAGYAPDEVIEIVLFIGLTVLRCYFNSLLHVDVDFRRVNAAEAA